MQTVIMAGGSGTRFWPFSRKNRPKQFLKIIGDRPMIEETCNRLSPLVGDHEIIIILGKDHRDEAIRIFEGRDIEIIAEPVGRNTAPCIGLGALYAMQKGNEGAVAFLPADHYIADVPSFLTSLRQAGEVAESGDGGIVTLGIPPTRPETGYGYIQRSDYILDTSYPAYRVSAFVEKPDLDTAKKYLVDGKYFWNAGIFVTTPRTILSEIRKNLPDLHEGLLRLKDPISNDSFSDVLKEVYENLEPVSFDYGIMEKTDAPVSVIPCNCGWSDVGSWESLYELRQTEFDDCGNVLEGKTLLVDCRNSLISGKSGRLIAGLGIENCIIIDTDDALLVADLRRSQEIREIIEQLKSRNYENLL